MRVYFPKDAAMMSVSGICATQRIGRFPPPAAQYRMIPLAAACEKSMKPSVRFAKLAKPKR
jgi:hypothetical protein